MMRHGSRLMLVLGLGFVCTIAQATEPVTWDQAMAHKQAGEYPEAIEAFKTLLEKQPASQEIHHQLGTVLGWSGRYDEAVDVFQAGLKHHPGDRELRLGYGRALAWRGDYKTAATVFNELLEADPSDREAANMKGRLYAWQRQLDAAESTYEAILAQAPDDVDALTGLGDVYAWREDFEGALGYYQQALTHDPDSAALQDKIRRIEDAPGPWRFDAGFRFSTFRRGNRQDWYGTYGVLRYRINNRTAIQGTFEWNRRFGQDDYTFEGAIDHRFNDRLWAYVAGAYTPDANFFADWYVKAGLEFNLITPDAPTRIPPNYFLFDWKHSSYSTGDADFFAVGLRQVITGRWSATGKLLVTRNLNDEWSAGWLARVDWLAWDNVAIYGGVANSQESFDQTVFALARQEDTWAYFGGIAWEVTPLFGVRFDYAYESVKTSVIQHAFNWGLFVRF